MLKVANLNVSIGSAAIIRDVSLEIEDGGAHDRLSSTACSSRSATKPGRIPNAETTMTINASRTQDEILSAPR